MKPKLITLIMLLPALACCGAVINLEWDHSPDRAELAGYRVYAGTNAGFALSNAMSKFTLAATQTNATIVATNAGRLWFKVTAFTTMLESEPSNEITTYVPGPPVLRIRPTFQAALDPTGPWRDLAQLPEQLVTVTNDATEYFRLVLGLRREDWP